MERKLNGKLESVGRVGIRNKETNEIIGIYPYKVEGSDEEIENKVKSWFYPNTGEAEKHFGNCFVDTLSYKELMNAKDSFAD
jgi:hypothetical protein